MSVNPKRLLAVAAFAAIPLLAPTAANAAIAGAPAGTTTLRPDLRSATVTNYDAATGITTARVCWDQPIASVPAAGAITAGTYNGNGPTVLLSGERPADSAARVGDSCADVVWNTADIEPTTRTYVRTFGGAVASLATGDFNLADSVPLVGSNTHNGTKGHQQAPDLEGVQLVPAGNYVRYIFDQKVDPVTVNRDPDNWQVLTQQGNVASALDIDATPGDADDLTVSGNVVQVRFLPSSIFPPAPDRAVQASVEGPNGNDAGDFSVVDSAITAVNPTRQTAAVPGTGGQSTLPDLISVDVKDGDEIDFVFDETINPGANFGAAGFIQIGLSTGFNGVTGTEFAPALATDEWSIVNGNTIRVEFNAGNRHEHVVWGAVNEDIVVSATDGDSNEASGQPAGGNQGAFAIGFTTGPDAMRAAVDTATGVVSIRLDQRFAAFTDFNINLVDDAGAIIPGNPSSVAGAGGAAGQVIAQAQFTPGEVAGARSVQLTDGAFTTAIGVPNVDQLLGFSGTAKFAKKNGKVSWTKPNIKKASKKTLKKFKAVKRSFKRVR